MAKCDLHVHSRFSNRPKEWIFRQLGVSESYTSPREVYSNAKAKEMDFVTLTDHDTIDGGLEIADCSDVFLSEEVTTCFSDGVKFHLLVWGLNESQHQDIQSIKNDVLVLVTYLRENKIAHGVAHPLVAVDKNFSVDHFEKLLLLFRIFEGLNGLRNPLANEVLQACFSSLTPEKIQELAHKHHIIPIGPEPWLKILTGGSDDHGGLFVAHAYTETLAPARTSREFLKELYEGKIKPQGQGSSVPLLASGIYHTAQHFIRGYLEKRAPFYANLLSKMVERFLAGKNPTVFSFKDKVSLGVDAIRYGQVFSLLKLGKTLPKEFYDFLKQPDLKERLDLIISSESLPERRAFLIASELTNYLGYRLFKQALDRASAGDFLGVFQSFSALVPMASTLLPYFAAFQSLFANRRFLEKVANAFPEQALPLFQKEKRAWFTDTLDDVNGVARTIRTMTKHARLQGYDLTVITSRSELEKEEIPIKNFRPVGEFEIPEYKIQRLSFPPVLEMLDYILRENFSEVIISTPGPVGLVGLMAAKMFGLKVSGIYHTDFPQYVKILSEDDAMESLTWKYMEWFYGQLNVIYSNSHYYRDLWKERGIPSEKLKILPRGLDTDLFNVKHRDTAYWPKRGLKEKVALYVGRISKEKDLDLLPEIAKTLAKRDCKISWALVGDGPYREELQAKMPQAIFTGVLSGEELGIAYASADFFVFPSTTDTFGNVVTEACSSGLPVIVSDKGGPKELVKLGIPGSICKAREVSSFAEAVESWCQNSAQFKKPDLAILQGWEAAVKQFCHGLN